jgi:uncharacterized protein (DUF1015 family)
MGPTDSSARPAKPAHPPRNSYARCPPYDADVTAAAGAQPSRTRTLELAPFRGVRYQRDRVSSLAAVTSPPYDVLEADGVVALEKADIHNVVRLILPRDDDCGPEGRYEHAARALRKWLAEGVLTVDQDAALYVYEQSTGERVLQRGLLGAVGLRDPAERVVLPHEDVMAGPVRDRLDLMRAARANVEPILLMYDGTDGPTARMIERATQQPASVTATTPDGVTHRLWPLTDPELHDAVAADLAPRQALIADGHHRYAAYRALQAERGDHSPHVEPADYGLALLVDLRAYPPYVGAIHRTVSRLSYDQAVESAAASGLFSVEPVTRDDILGLAEALTPGELLVVGPQGIAQRPATVVRVKDAAAVDALITDSDPEPWRGLDTAVLHRALIEHVWHAPDDSVGYHHTASGALRAVDQNDGVAILLAPVPVQTVLDLAAKGVRMPRKSTSFGPKPRTGLVLRSFDADRPS